MSIHWSRTSYEGGYRKVFHVVPSGSTNQSDLVRKYGSDSVFVGDGAADQAIIARALGQCTSGGNDLIRIYPGTYVFNAVLTVAKGVTIEGAVVQGRAMSILSCTANNVATISATAAGVVIRGLGILESDSGTVDAVTLAGAGSIIEDCQITGGNIASTTATVVLSGANSLMRRCKITSARKSVIVSASGCSVVDNQIITAAANSGDFGISTSGTVTGINIDRNVIYGGASNYAGIIVAANCTLSTVADNGITAADPITPTGTAKYFRNTAGDATTAAWIVT